MRDQRIDGLDFEMDRDPLWSSDGVSKVNTDSLSSDPPQQVKITDPPLLVVKTKSPAPLRTDPQSSPSFRKNTPGESTSTTLSNSIPGIRHKEPQYPLDKYLPRIPKRDDTFIKSREIPLRKDVSLFRKIESLLKESQCIREPIVNCNPALNEAQLNVSSGSSISTEDLVAAEFYKATYGTPKKADCSKPKIAVPSHKKGAGDWADPRNPHRCELDPKPQIENVCRESFTAVQLPWDGRNRISALSPKTIGTETCCHPAGLQTFESCSNYKMTSECGINVEKTGEVKKISAIDIEKPQPKPKTFEACSFYSVPSVSIPTSPSRLRNEGRTLQQISVQNVGINTDRVNTQVFSMKHSDPDVVGDFAGQNRIKACVVQELPKVNIRARLVQQSCGFVSINPVDVPNEYQNTAIVEVSHYNDQSEEHLGRHISTEFSGSPKRQTEQNVQGAVVNQLPDSGYYLSHPFTSPKRLASRTHPPAVSHRLAFDTGRRCTSPQGPHGDQKAKPKIFDTVSHFKEQLSRDFSSGFDSIKTSLTEMVSSLNELFDIGLNNFQGLRDKSKSTLITLKVDRMDGILTEELNKWGQRDSAHYCLLTKAIDELTAEMKSALESFHQQQRLIERTNTFLEGSAATAHQNKGIDQNMAKTVRPLDPLRLDKLYAIHSYLQQSLPSCSGTQEHVDSRINKQHCGYLEKDDKYLTVKTKFDETFTIDPSPPDEMQAGNLQDALGEEEPSPQIENNHSKGETHGDYEDDFMPEDQDDPESDSDQPASDSSQSDKTAEDVAAKPDENLLLRTYGPANGDESNDAPVTRVAFEEPLSSVASTINASQANLKSQVEGCKVHKPIPIQTDIEARVQKNLKITDNSSDKPLVRLTNRNTNAVFELRLPEQLENLGSTLIYNSVGCNDEIKLSFGCTGANENAQTTKAPIIANDAIDKNSVPIDDLNKIDEVGDSSQPCSQPKQTCGNEPFCSKYAGMCSSGHLQNVGSPHEVSLRTETFPSKIPRISHRNEGTQFPSVDVESAERLSTSILLLIESKINEMVEANKQKLWSNESKFKDFSVQVVPSLEVGKEPISHSGSNAVACPLSLSSTNIHTPEKAAKLPEITPNVTPLQSDGYDSHPRNLDKPTDYLVFKQTEHEMDKMLAQYPQFSVQLESSFSSMSVPTSVSEFPVKSSSTSSSELAVPLAKLPTSKYDDLQRLNPAPDFNYVSVDRSNSNHEERSDVVELQSHRSSVGDITTHLHPNPEDLAELQSAIWVGAKEEIEEANEASECVIPVVEVQQATTSVYEIQPYDSDLMSEGEVGYVYTSNSYSSGEIVERRKPNAAICPDTPHQKDGRTFSGDGIRSGAPPDKRSTEHSNNTDQDPHADVTRLNEESSSATSTETTTSESS